MTENEFPESTPTRSDEVSPPFRRDPNTELLHKLKEHIVQIEALVVYTVICVVTVTIISQFQLRLPVWLVPSIFLIGIRQVVRVTNPPSKIRNALVWAATIGGVVGAVAGAAADMMAGGLTVAQGTMWGYAGGAAAGAALGNWIESLGNKDDLLERGDAFDYLFAHRRKNPKVANPKLVSDALDKEIPFYDKNQDGRKWYSRDDLDKFLLK